jgi:hypothetical protein
MSGKFDFINCSKYRAACEQGSTFTKTLYLKNKCQELMDLTGFSASMNVRAKVADSETIFNLSSSGGNGIVIDAVNSTITVTIAAADTTAAVIGKHVYDLEITKDGLVTRLIEGTFEITPEVTR